MVGSSKWSNCWLSVYIFNYEGNTYMVADRPMKVSKVVKDYLDKKRKYDRESYDGILKRLLKLKINIPRQVLH